MEAKELLLSTNNIFSPSSGKPVLMPSQDVVLGVYYLTLEPHEKPAEGRHVPLIANRNELELAYADGVLKVHDWVDYVNPDFGNKDTTYGVADKKMIRTTVGRVLFSSVWPKDLGFINFLVNKGKLSDLILNSYRKEGKEGVVVTLDKLKDMGFKMAMRAGISIGIIDMIVPKKKAEIIAKARERIDEITSQYKKGIITDKERYSKVIEAWTAVQDTIGKEAFNALQNNGGKEGINPVYVLMDSGARGNKQQVRQLCGARGLMATPSGEIIERPVLSSFREGLSVLEYFVSTHGARKGLSDTALKTADAGYMTRKLCDVAMDVIVNCHDDGRRDGVWKKAIYQDDQELISLKDRIEGRCPSEDIYNPLNPSELWVKNGEVISESMAQKIQDSGTEKVKVLSPLTLATRTGVPAVAYGIHPATQKMVEVGAAVGIIAAQSIGEPGTQLTLRTFHVGGVASSAIQNPKLQIHHAGIVHYKGLRLVTLESGQSVVLNKTGFLNLVDADGRELESYNIVAGAILFVQDGQSVKSGDTLAQWDPHSIPVLSEKAGMVVYRDVTPGITVKRQRDEATGNVASVVIEHKEDLTPQIEIYETTRKGPFKANEIAEVAKNGKLVATYPIPTGAQIQVNEGDVIAPGGLIAKTPRQAARTQDITGGLPRIAELFEARRPKETAEMSKIDGIVSMGGILRGKRRLIVTHEETGHHEEHLIPHTKHIVVQPGDLVSKGQLLTEGSPDPHEILDIMGVTAVQEHLITEIQRVYRLQGVTINDKHIELIISQMLRKVRVTDPGDTDFFWGEQVEKAIIEPENARVVAAGGQPASVEPILLGITKASLETESFIAAASFQETTRVLTEAATLGKVDHLRGFKENVIMGNLIPAGTGFAPYRHVQLDGEGIDKRVEEAPATEAPAPQASSSEAS
jgi:DNA-directed RNA polymerase subunit beta'